MLYNKEVFKHILSILSMKIKRSYFAYAKLNLSLEVLCKLENGYHWIRSVVAPISLADELVIEVERGAKGISFRAEAEEGV